MQNFKNGIVPLADNRLSSLMDLSKKELSTLYEKEELETISYWLLEHFAGVNKKTFLIDQDAHVNQSNVIHFCNAIEKLKQGTPVQYVIGIVDFYGLKLEVNNSVLIPRPETEELVDIIVKQNFAKEKLRILDIGTGSGCIALSLAARLKGSSVTAVDISEKALQTAKTNSELNSISNVEFILGDILGDNFLAEIKYDMIVSNPPYIAYSERKSMSKNVVDFEPEQALFVPDNDELIFYNQIVRLSEKCLKGEGLVYIEINERLGDETLSLFTNNIFGSAEIINDMFGKNRFIKAVRL